MSNKLTATEKAQNIGILVGTWLAVFGLNTLARTPKPMSQIMQMVGMVIIFWTILAAVFFTGVFCKNSNRQTRPFLENHPASHRFTVALDGCLRKHIKRSFQAP